MAREFGRHRRMAELIKHELATLIQRDFPVVNYGLIAVSAVDLSPDLSNATVFVTGMGDTAEEQIVELLNEHSGQFRHAVAKAVCARSVPKLRFTQDKSIARMERMSALLAAK